MATRTVRLPGIFAPDHVRVPRAEVPAGRPGWSPMVCATRGPEELGRICEEEPQLVRRGADRLAAPLLAAPR